MTGIKNLPRWSNQKGQVLVLVALMFLILIAFIGLAIDVGVVFVGYSRLRRAVDAAALSAASQIRKGVQIQDLTKAAEEFLRLNHIDSATATVAICDPANPDPELCTTPKRKLVRVTASSTIPLSFMSVLGFRNVTVSAKAVSEAASLDLVLLIDTSESMNSDVDTSASDYKNFEFMGCNDQDKTGVGDGADGPPNLPGECHPFEEVKRAAYEFVDTLYFPYDRVSVVTFDQRVSRRLPLSDNKTDVQDAIRNLAMMGVDDDNNVHTYDKTWVPDCPGPGYGLCLKSTDNGDGTTTKKTKCDSFTNPSSTYYRDPTMCTNTNIGGGVEMAGNVLNSSNRPEAVWIIVLLTDGAANAAVSPFHSNQANAYVAQDQDWICPFTLPADPSAYPSQPFCRDASASTRHPASDTANYDADDYARDMMDAVTTQRDPVTHVKTGQLIYMYTIGLGNDVIHNPNGDADAGQQLLQYAASKPVGDGYYTFSSDATKLRAIFKDIANNIATRLAK
jgi:hypothetical protein